MSGLEKLDKARKHAPPEPPNAALSTVYLARRDSRQDSDLREDPRGIAQPLSLWRPLQQSREPDADPEPQAAHLGRSPSPKLHGGLGDLEVESPALKPPSPRFKPRLTQGSKTLTPGGTAPGKLLPIS